MFKHMAFGNRHVVRRVSRGFTIVELLIVIVVIGALAALVMTSFSGAQDRARQANAEHGVAQLFQAVRRLELDTGRSVFGCPLNDTSNPEGQIENPDAGLVSRPAVGLVEGQCEWMQAAVDKWKGPYFKLSTKDPWGSTYVVDHDYIVCESTTRKVVSAVLSPGKDKVITYPTTASNPCTPIETDDIYKVLYQ